jgi:hypothetical protein
MTGLHVPSIHFHIGAWTVTALSISLAFVLNFLDKRGLLPQFIKNFMGEHVIQQLDYVSMMTGIVGLSGLLLSVWTGLIDATGVKKPNYIDINLLVQGYEFAISNPILGFKVIWAFVGVQFFLLVLGIRTYFVTIKKEKSVFDQNMFIQILYVESALIGMFLMLVIAGAGGIWVSGASIFSDLPILQEFLPGGIGTVPLFFFAGIFSVLLIISMVIKEKNN